jgi:hypothetical protein
MKNLKPNGKRKLNTGTTGKEKNREKLTAE